MKRPQKLRKSNEGLRQKLELKLKAVRNARKRLVWLKGKVCRCGNLTA